MTDEHTSRANYHDEHECTRFCEMTIEEIEAEADKLNSDAYENQKYENHQK